MRIRLKIAKKCWLYLDIFSCVKINVFRSFFAFRLKMHVRCNNQYKTGAGRGSILGQPRLFECMGICVLSPKWGVYVLIVKYLSHRFCLNSATVYKIGWLYHGIFWGFLKTFLEWSVDHIIYRNYIANWHSFIYCSLACSWISRFFFFIFIFWLGSHLLI